ncbi:hypothetical protein ACOMHN_041196 [Nucella lapillus]
MLQASNWTLFPPPRPSHSGPWTASSAIIGPGGIDPVCRTDWQRNNSRRRERERRNEEEEQEEGEEEKEEEVEEEEEEEKEEGTANRGKCGGGCEKSRCGSVDYSVL